MENNSGVLYYVNIYKKQWKFVLVFVVISMFFAMIFSLSRSETYSSTVTILTQAAGVGSASGLEGLLGIRASSDDIIVTILKSGRMANAINDRFSRSKGKKKIWWKISVWKIPAGLNINVKGADPVLTRDIANFVVDNLDKINEKLSITPNKPMVKLLDPAVLGVKLPDPALKNMFIAGMLSFLLVSSCIFLLEYFKKLKIKLS